MKNQESYSIKVSGLKKSFGDLKVLKGIDFAVKKGEILALLGPNGAGKTTTIRILSTLLLPDEGQAFVNNHNVEKEPNLVRASIGLTGQYAAVDEYLTGRENLEMVGQLYRMSRQEVKRKSHELIEKFDLAESSDRPVKTYSGGMRRRIDLAMSIIASPPIIFLDEPTTGLDPRSRITMWEIIKELALTDITILLTTQYMEEADNLSDRIIVIDHGGVIAEGTPQELKAKVGSEHLEFIVSPESDFEKAAKVLYGKTLRTDKKRRSLSIPTKNGAGDLQKTLNSFEKEGIELESLSLHRPTLDDVFLTLTGHGASEESESGENNSEQAKNHEH